MKRTAWIAAASLAVGLVAGGWLAQQEDSWNPWSQAAAQTADPIAPVLDVRSQPLPPNLTPEEQRNIYVYETANRSVVNIDTTIVAVDRFWGQRQAEGSGSGAVLDRQGHILTNYHVIGAAQESGRIDVTLASNNTYPAELVGGDEEHDIAILKIEAPAEELFPIPLGSSDQLRVGQRVYALGNPFGWDGTLTTGIISSLNRNLPSPIPGGRGMQSLIQTDAAMNPGNSGGPLLNTNAEMIGMCVAIASRTGQNSGVGFAIPISRIKSFLPDLIERGHIVRADIGISEVMETSGGLVIGRINPEGPAAQAGLRGFRVVSRRQGPYVQTTIDRSQADRILAIDGAAVATGVQFRDKIWEHAPGDIVSLTIVRDGQKMEIQVTLAAE